MHCKAYHSEIKVRSEIQRMPITIGGAMIHKMRGNQGSFIVREAKSIDCERETAVVEYSRLSLEFLVVTEVVLKYYDSQVI